MTCEYCDEAIAFLEAQTSRNRVHWHTLCWNHATEKWQQHRDEKENLQGFAANTAPPDQSRPALPEELGPKPKWSEVLNDMATATNRQPRDVVDFPPNAPVTLALKYAQGKIISGPYGERVMFSLTDGRVMFLAPDVAGRIESLGINVRESFTLTRAVDENGAPAPWDVARVTGVQPDGTLRLPAPIPSPKPPASAASAESELQRKRPGTALVEEANALVDSFAQVLERSLTMYQGRVKPEEVKSLLISAYIQRQKLSSAA